MKRSIQLLLAILATIPVAGCGGTTDPTPPPGTRLFQFVMRHQPQFTFRAATGDPAVLAMVDAQLALAPDQRTMHLNGPIERGDGGHNAPWNWHWTPSEWVMADLSIEICDGTPSFVAENLDAWLVEVGSYCPWDAIVDREVK